MLSTVVLCNNQVKFQGRWPSTLIFPIFLSSALPILLLFASLGAFCYLVSSNGPYATTKILINAHLKGLGGGGALIIFFKLCKIQVPNLDMY